MAGSTASLKWESPPQWRHTATKNSEETILVLLLQEVNHGPSQKNYRQGSLHSAGDGSSVIGTEAVGFFLSFGHMYSSS